MMYRFFQRRYLKRKVKSFRWIMKNISILPNRFEELSDRVIAMEQNLSAKIERTPAEKAGEIHQQLHNVKQAGNLIAARQPVGRKTKVVFLAHSGVF